MEQLLEILEDIQPDVDYNTCEDLVDGHILDSLSIISLVAELEDEFGFYEEIYDFEWEDSFDGGEGE